ncbi:MAG: hypothetical protein U5N85_11290 [Arcicella sp.]|nr:hypothetical protein [Arcicella sp.]
MKKYKFDKLLCLLFFAFPFLTFAQYTDKWISLKYETVRHKPNHFYFQKVKDERKDGSKIGNIYGENQTKKHLKLSGGIIKSVQNYFSKSFIKYDTDYPIIFKITNLSVDENLINSKITGKCKIKVSYSFLRDTTEIELTDFQTSITYYRTQGDYNNYETLMSKVIEKSVVYFNEWMGENYDKNPKLIRSLALVFWADYEIDSPEKGDTIFWSPSRKMSWSDFTGTMPKSSKYSAQIFNNFEYLAPLKLTDGKLTILLQMKVYMLKSGSWTSSTTLSDYSIAHEQLHFDIAKVTVERFKQKAKQILTIDNYDSELQLLFIEMYREMNRLQREYDEESNHSINVAGQLKWQSQISEELRNYGVR